MSAINLKSITGITSITTPAGVDNQLTLHTNDTTQRVKVTQSGIEVVGIATFQDIDVDGHTNLDNVSIAGVTTTTGFIESVGNSGRGAKLGGLSVGYDSLYATIQPISGTSLHLNYNAGTHVKIGAANTKVDLDVNGDVYPKASGNRDLGLTGKKWKDVHATTYYGDGSNLTGITGVTINGNTNNRLVTATGTTGTLDGEANLTFDGTNLSVTGAANVAGTLIFQPGGTAWSTTNTRPQLGRQADGELRLGAGSDSSSIVTFYTSPSAGGTLTEKLRITSGGNVRVESGVIENAKTISSNYTVSSNYNAMSAGPMTVASGVSVTVPSGSAWTIV